MANVTITLTDKLDGNVKIVATPTFEEMAMKAESGNMPTAAEAYALYCLRMIREQSKKQGKLQHKIPGA